MGPSLSAGVSEELWAVNSDPREAPELIKHSPAISEHFSPRPWVLRRAREVTVLFVICKCRCVTTNTPWSPGATAASLEQHLKVSREQGTGLDAQFLSQTLPSTTFLS